MQENITLAQVSGNYYSKCLLYTLLIVCLHCFSFILSILFWLPSFSLTDKYPVMFKVILTHHTCWTNVLYPAFCSHCHCMYNNIYVFIFFYFLPKNS